MNRTVKFALIGAGVSLVAIALWNYEEQYKNHTVTTANPADTHYAAFSSVLTSSATPLTLGIGVLGGIIAAKVL